MESDQPARSDLLAMTGELSEPNAEHNDCVCGNLPGYAFRAKREMRAALNFSVAAGFHAVEGILDSGY